MDGNRHTLRSGGADGSQLELYKDKSEEFRFRLKAGNGRPSRLGRATRPRPARSTASSRSRRTPPTHPSTTEPNLALTPAGVTPDPVTLRCRTGVPTRAIARWGGCGGVVPTSTGSGTDRPPADRRTSRRARCAAGGRGRSRSSGRDAPRRRSCRSLRRCAAVVSGRRPDRRPARRRRRAIRATAGRRRREVSAACSYSRWVHSPQSVQPSVSGPQYHNT